MPESGSKPLQILPPHYRDIPAGGELQGTARARLPLGAWRNFGTAGAIYGHRTSAVLEIEYYDYPDVDASNVHNASWRTQPRKLLRGAVKPLPESVTVASPEEQAKRSFGNVVLGCPSPCAEPQQQV